MRTLTLLTLTLAACGTLPPPMPRPAPVVQMPVHSGTFHTSVPPHPPPPAIL